MKKKIAIINGINLGELGTREVNIYGYLDFTTYFKQLQSQFHDVDLIYFQSDEVEQITKFMLANKAINGFVLNPGAFTHTSIILADTISAIATPVVEVHISNLYGREQYRKHSFVGSKCRGTITGFGLVGYQLALQFLIMNYEL